MFSSNISFTLTIFCVLITMPPKTAPKTAPKTKSKPKSKPGKKGGPKEKLKSKNKKKERKKPSSKEKKNAKKSAPKSKVAPATAKAPDSTPASKVESPATSAFAGVPASPSNKTQFAMENCPNPEELKPSDITRMYKIPNNQYKTEGDVIAQNGYMLEEKVQTTIFEKLFSSYRQITFTVRRRWLWCDLFREKQKDKHPGRLQDDGTWHRLGR